MIYLSLPSPQAFLICENKMGEWSSKREVLWKGKVYNASDFLVFVLCDAVFVFCSSLFRGVSSVYIAMNVEVFDQSQISTNEG